MKLIDKLTKEIKSNEQLVERLEDNNAPHATIQAYKARNEVYKEWLAYEKSRTD